jgi:hypothetical protein
MSLLSKMLYVKEVPRAKMAKWWWRWWLWCGGDCKHFRRKLSESNHPSQLLLLLCYSHVYFLLTLCWF